MDLFQASGEARLLAHEGQRQMAALLAAKLRTWWSQVKEWQAAMPTTLPPTEPSPR